MIPNRFPFAPDLTSDTSYFPTQCVPTIRQFHTLNPTPHNDLPSDPLIPALISADDLDLASAVGICEAPRSKTTFSNPSASKHGAKVKPKLLEDEDHSKRWRKDYHNAIEKRRRDQINSYIEDLQILLLEEKVVTPNCDKVTTLSAAIDYLKTYNSRLPTFSISSFVKSEFTSLFTELDATFLLTFRCLDYMILYVSDGATGILGIPPSMLIGQVLLNFIHLEEVEDFKSEQRARQIKWNNLNSKREEKADINFVNNMIAKDLETGHHSLLPILFRGEFKRIPNLIPDKMPGDTDALCFAAALKSLI